MTVDAHPPETAPCYPEQAVGSELDGELVVLLRPRFTHGPLAWWLQPRLRNPFLRVRLDALGSFVWARCDGRTTVVEILRQMETELGGTQLQLERRLLVFLRQLERGEMVRLRTTPVDDQGSTLDGLGVPHDGGAPHDGG